MHFRHLQCVITIICLIIKPKFGMMHTFRFLQETMLQASLNSAQPNYDIIFECRSTSNLRVGRETHFSLQLGNLEGFRLLDGNKKLALFLHGWNDKGSRGWVQDMLKTWTFFAPTYNVCVVDWGHLSQRDYKSASMSTFDVGLTVASIVDALERISSSNFHRSNVTLAGYSLGAHAAGFAGAVLNGEVEQIIGLDPAGPLFTMPAVVSTRFRLDPSDARFVQVLHTSAGTLGSSVKAGHADFYPNGGTVPQPNCHLFSQLEDIRHTNPIGCSHSTAAAFFKQSMDPNYVFMGHQCDSYNQFFNGQCRQNRRGRFGIHSMRASEGNFYFETGPSKPYVRPLMQRHNNRFAFWH